MNFLSTRGMRPPPAWAQAIAAGLAPDGGLYVPESLPAFSIGGLRRTARRSPRSAHGCSRRSSPAIALAGSLGESARRPSTSRPPLSRLRRRIRFMLELFHGPTAAFKDFGARFLAACMRRAARGRIEAADDPGRHLRRHRRGGRGGVPSACRDLRVVILYPDGRVSPRQAHQLGCFGDNVHRAARRRQLRRLPALVKTGA